MEFITNNYQWIFSGIGVAVIGWLIIAFKKDKNKKTTKNTQSTNNVITINNGNTSSSSKPTSSEKSSAIKHKEDYRILFIDDNHSDFKMVSILKKANWTNTKALKDKYPQKTIILYSAEPTGDRFDKKLKKVDDSLPKNAEPYEFISLIEQYSNISE
jgi:hypothetical protein